MSHGYCHWVNHRGVFPRLFPNSCGGETMLIERIYKERLAQAKNTVVVVMA